MKLGHFTEVSAIHKNDCENAGWLCVCVHVIVQFEVTNFLSVKKQLQLWRSSTGFLIPVSQI